MFKLSRLVAASAVACLLAYTPALASESLVSDTRSAAQKPVKDKLVKVILKGTGSATVTVVYSYDGGSTFQPKTVATDGSAPIVMDKVAYNGATQNGLVIEVSDSVLGYALAVLPGTVTGSVTVDYAQ